MSLTCEQSRVARDLLGWSDEDLAHAAGVSIFTVRRFERRVETSDGPAADPDPVAVISLRRALEGAGIAFGDAAAGDLSVRIAIPAP